MTANDMPRTILEREKRERIEQIEDVLRHHNPEATREELKELTRRIYQQSVSN